VFGLESARRVRQKRGMKSPLRSKFLLIPLAAALSLLAVRLFAQTTPDPFEGVLHLVFPGTEVTVKKEDFAKALADHSKEDKEGRLHQIWWDEKGDGNVEQLPGGIKAASKPGSSASPKPMTSEKKIVGRHVAQSVGFDSVEKLKEFVIAVKPSPTPTPGKGG
jgi:hypothetical protein